MRSRAWTLCVSAPTETGVHAGLGDPADGVEGDGAGRLQRDRPVAGQPGPQLHHPAQVRRRHVVQQQPGRAGPQRLARPRRPSAPRRRPAGRALGRHALLHRLDGRGHAARGGHVVLLQQHHRGQVAPVVGRPAGGHRVLVQRPQAPGAVLRVSSTRTGRPSTAATKAAARVAMPHIRCRKFSAVRSAVRMDRADPVHGQQRVAGPTRSPSATSGRPGRSGSTWPKTSAATGIPATTPAPRARTDRVRAPVGRDAPPGGHVVAGGVLGQRPPDRLPHLCRRQLHAPSVRRGQDRPRWARSTAWPS